MRETNEKGGITSQKRYGGKRTLVHPKGGVVSGEIKTTVRCRGGKPWKERKGDYQPNKAPFILHCRKRRRISNGGG